MMSLAPDWGTCFVATVAAEAAVVWLLCGRRPAPLVAVVLLNAVTHPLAWWAVTSLGVGFLPAEGGIFLIEACGLGFAAGLPWMRAAAVSGLANALTATIAVVLIEAPRS